MDLGATSGTISADKLCELTGWTDRRHRQLAKDGYFPNPLRGQYKAKATIQGLFKYCQEQLHKKDDSIKKAEHRLKSAKADMAEEELAVYRKKYVLKEEIGPALRNVSLHQRAVLQRKLENEVAPNLAGKKTAEILVIVKAAVDEICGIFQEGARPWMTTEPESPQSTVHSPQSEKEGKAPAQKQRRRTPNGPSRTGQPRGSK